MDSKPPYRVKQVAELAGVTIRALHHYDEIGLLVPAARSAAGYRLYTEADVLKLHQIIVGRELGLSLEEIRRLLDDPQTDPVVLLAKHREALCARREKADSMIQAIDRALAQIGQDTPMTNKDAKAMFDGFDPSSHESEARARWGQTDAYAESRRTRDYSKDDWRRMKSESDDILSRLAAEMRAGTPPSAAAAIELADAHRLHIDRWFYPCTKAMHQSLAEMYEADERFAASFNAHAEGLASYISKAIKANDG